MEVTLNETDRLEVVLKRFRRDEERLQTAVNGFNRDSLFWQAYILDKETIGFATIFTLSARTSSQSIKPFLETSSQAFYQAVQASNLTQHIP